MLKREELQAFIEREGIQDFIWTRTYEDIPGTEIGLYHLANDRYGCVFKVSPPVYAGPDSEKKLSIVYKTNLPNRSSIQFFTFSSRNLSEYKGNYKALHSSPGNIEKADVMRELCDNKVDWIQEHANKSIYQRGIDFRLRNFINICCITIPKRNEDGVDISKAEVINVFTRVYSALSDFAPQKFPQTEYVKVMREILVPDFPLWSPPEDKITYLNQQVVDNNSTLVIDDDSHTLGIGTLISKKDYEKKIKDELSVSSLENNTDEATGVFNALKKMLKKNSKIKEDRKAFTNWHAKVYTTKQFPSHTSLHKMIEKFYDLMGSQIEPEVPCPFFSSLTVYIEDKEKLKKEVFEKTQWNLWQTTSLGDVVRFFPEIRDRAQESEAINELLNQGEAPMSAMWSVVVMDNSIMKTNQYGERLRKKFMEDNWILQEETIIPHWMFLYSLPLQFEPFVLKDCAKRMNTLFTSNCAAITPIMTGAKGFGGPVLLYVDRTGQLAGVDIFSSTTNYNFIVVGSSGSGKSYAMADFFSQYLMRGAKIRVIDVGRSYKGLCDVICGQYIEFTEEADIRLNFFTKIELNDQGNIHEDELQTIVPLVAMMAMISLNAEDINNDISIPVISGYISKAVTMAFESRQRNAGMQDVSLALEAIYREAKNDSGESDKLIQDLIVALYPFSNPKGEYYKYFNGPNNLDFRSDFVVIELEELDSKDLLKSVVLAAVSHRINTEFFLGDLSQPKILCIDEAWSIMDNKIVVRFLETMARRIRKYYGASGIITQTIGDFYKNKATRAIFDSSAMKFFLQQGSDSIDAAQGKGELNLTEGLLMLMKTVKSKTPYYSEVLIKQDSGSFFIGRLITDKVSHWIYTNHPKDMDEVRMISAKFGVSALDARLIKGYSQKENITVDESYIKRSKAGLLLN